jgi:hypothetical protein
MGLIFLYSNVLSLFAQLFVIFLVTLYLWRIPQKLRETWLAFGIAGSGLLSAICYFFEVGVVTPTPWQEHFDLWTQNTLLLLLVFALQTPYHYYADSDEWLRREGRRVLVVSCSLLLFKVSLVAAPLFWSRASIYELSSWVILGLLAAASLWQVVTYLRRAVALSKHPLGVILAATALATCRYAGAGRAHLCLGLYPPVGAGGGAMVLLWR